MPFDERLLEFHAIRELLGRHAVCQLGRNRIDDMRPTADREQLFPAIGLVREMMGLVAAHREPPVQGLRDVTAHLSKVARERAFLEPAELLDLKDFLEAAGAMRRFFEPQQNEQPALHALAMPLQNLPALHRSIDEKIAPNGTVRDGASDLLSRLRSDIAGAEASIQRDLTRMVREFTETGDLQDDFFTLRNDRYVLPVKTSNRGKVPGIIHDSSNTGETVFIEPFAILEQTNRLADLRLREREEVYRILLKIAGHIRDEMNALLTDLDLLCEFDFVLAKARFGVLHKCAFPTLSGMDKPLNLVNAHHALLFAQNPEASRPLNMGLDAVDRVLVITGPNAGGKTTALKTIGLTCIMVQSGVPAPLDSRSRLPVFSDVLANIGDEQSILEGQSTFSGHIKRIAQIIRASDRESLVLLDELGTATDPGEGGALAVAILETLSDRGALTIVSSHLGVLKTWAHSHDHGRNASFRLSDRDHRPTYSLTLDMIGISEALVVAEQVGLPPEVLERARALRPHGEAESTALLLSLQEKEQRLAEELEAAERLRYGLEDRQRELNNAEAQLRDEKRKFRQKMLDDRERAITEMRARVEATIAKLPGKQELLQVKRELEEEQASIRSEAVREETTEEKRARKNTSPLQPGETVRVKALGEQGVIQSVDVGRNQARVTVGRVLATVKLSDLQRLPKPPEQEAQSEPTGGHVFYRRPEMPQSTLDLHGNRVEEAIGKIDKFFDQALASGFSSAKLMHGQGSGALRKAIHEYLRNHPVVGKYRYATTDEGGGGVTVVDFK
ncbi:MAG: endonuclease MutS2 [Candidatus Sumerlaeaceae bacterium]